MTIIHLTNNEIDRLRWDNCISQSYNQLTYAYSWYLDVVSPDWEALISENYEYIMPLPVKRRYKIPYLVQPILTQQLGIFGKNEIDENIVESFIKQIPYFSYELNFNSINSYSKAVVFPNFILDLAPQYDKLTAAYSKNTVRNIEKAIKCKLKIRTSISIAEFLAFYFSVEKKFLAVRQPVLEKLLNAGISTSSITLYGVYSADNKMIAGLCLLHSNNRLTYLLPVSNSEGKSTSAMFFLINQLIKNDAGKPKLLDFEGSKIEGIARFYRGFGAKNHPYYILKRFRPAFLVGK